MDFIFDCPMRVNLNTASNDGDVECSSDLSWFNVPHSSHEKSYESHPQHPPSQKDDIDRVIEPQVMTTVPMVSFTKKRPLSKMATITGKKCTKTKDHNTTVIDKENACSRPNSSNSTQHIADVGIVKKSSRNRVSIGKPQSAPPVSKVTRPGRQKPAEQSDQQDMLELLKKHNEKFAPVSLYEPPRHSVRDMRRWEKHSGRTWSTLKPDERGIVNEEISQMKKDKTGPFCV